METTYLPNNSHQKRRELKIFFFLNQNCKIKRLIPKQNGETIMSFNCLTMKKTEIIFVSIMNRMKQNLK